MRQLFFITLVLFISSQIALATDPTPPSQDTQPIIAELRKIQPMQDQAKAVEETLVAKGPDALPALRQARALGDSLVGDDELTTNTYKLPEGGTVVNMAPRKDRVINLAQQRLAVLDRAIIRLDWGFDPPLVLAQWAANRQAQGLDAKKLPNVPQLLSDPLVANLLRDFLFYSVSQPYRPVTRVGDGPSSWPQRTLFAIDRKQNVTLLAQPQDLETFFQAHFPAVQNASAAQDAVRVWLVASQALQDHVLFPIDENTVKAAQTQGGGWSAEGRAAGGSMQEKPLNDVGYVEVKLAFDPNGKLLHATEDLQFRPGLRPICQATKLLDPDPIVRKMAQQDLRLMGRSAEEYLRQRRTQASPELRAEIDRIWQIILDDERRFGRP